MRSNGWRGWGMTALVIFGFIAAAALAVSSMIDTVRRYGGLALDLDGALDRTNSAPWPLGPRPRGRRSIRSRGHVGTPRRALARGRQALGLARRSAGNTAPGQCHGKLAGS